MCNIPWQFFVHFLATKAVFPNTPNSTHFYCNHGQEHLMNLSTNHQALNDLNEVCLSRSTTKLCSVGGPGGPGLGNTALKVWLGDYPRYHKTDSIEMPSDATTTHIVVDTVPWPD
jgi:hypothetical protein